MASLSGQTHETAVEMEESVEATAQSEPAEGPRGSQEPRVRIPKVPEGHRYGGRDAYEPSIISFGPYHYGKPRLLPMESLKRQCFYELKERAESNGYLDECFKELEGMGMEARRCYPENTDHIKGDRDQLMGAVDHFCRHVSPINRLSNYLPEFTDTDSELGHLGSTHLLHLYRSRLFHRPGDTSDLNTALPYAKKLICTIRSATFLEEAGIELEQEVDGVMSVTFQNGIMKITPLFIDAFTVSQFRNLIALEKHDSSLEPQATAFARFMDYIINTSKDVDLLRKKGILDHSFGSDEEIATIFNQLTSGILEYRTLKLQNMYKEVDEYCKKKRHLWWAMLMKDYFSSPWTAISLVAAVILLSLTFIQTFFSMYSYFRPPSAK